MRDLVTSIDKHSSNKGKDLDFDADSLEAQRKEQEIIRYQHDTIDRKWYAKWACIFVSTYVPFVTIIICFNKSLFDISDNVLISLISATAIKIIGMMYIVLNGYFNSNKT